MGQLAAFMSDDRSNDIGQICRACREANDALYPGPGWEQHRCRGRFAGRVAMPVTTMDKRPTLQRKPELHTG